MAKQSLDEKFSRLRSPKNRRKKTPKWRKSDIVITPMMFVIGWAFTKTGIEKITESTILWDNYTHRPILSGFIVGWPYRALLRAIKDSRFNLAERNDL